MVIRQVFSGNKTGLQPVSRPVERFLGFFQKVYMKRFGVTSLFETHLNSPIVLLFILVGWV